ncbi:MAG: hypothetical protein EPN97_04270 [Alphaproteobacteria bacterium]|nr:MAG: hypothetical protein EPN97_04270 [Alphaproteobacteria bacterium]
MKFFFTPEFHRNLWLRFSPFRLIAAPLIILLIAMTTTRMPKGLGDFDVTSTLYAALSIYFIVVIIWGAYEAANAMQEEIRGNTWDFQRMSSISPWQLSLGKLFGVTSYAWYFGFLALALFAYAYADYRAPEQFFGEQNRDSPFPEPDNDTLYILFCLVASGIIAQSVAYLYGFADSLAMFGRIWRTKVPRGIGAFLVGAFAGSYVFTYTVMHDSVRLRPRASLMFQHVDIHWYGHDYERHLFVVMSLLFFIGWFLIGSYRIARAELMYRCMPTAWMLFVATYVGWASGFVPRGGSGVGVEVGAFHAALFAYIQAAIIAYACMFAEAGDSRRYARLAFHLKAGDFLRAFENTPKWLATLPIMLFLFFSALTSATGMEKVITLPHGSAFMASFMLFMARDGCAIHAIHLSFRGRGTGFALMFYYLIVYLLLPLLAFTSIDLNLSDVFKSVVRFKVPENVGTVTGTFYPTGMTDTSQSLFPVLIETIVTAGWLYWCLSRRSNPAPVVIENTKA